MTKRRASPVRGVLRLPGSDAGQSAVEFALVLPVLLLVVLGIGTFGIGMNNYISLTEATAEGVHQAAIDRLGTIDPCTAATTTVYNTVPTLTRSLLSFTLTINGVSYTGTSCGGATAAMAQGQPAVLTVTYPCSLWSYKYKFTGCTLIAKAQELIQ